ncbi:MAG: helix-turn-helix domain-containing protein, partial [Alphaproteobacteria bacterium]|nr:helix-turn-helix domain-containing protein [Alphaproteobacteria bacterium]
GQNHEANMNASGGLGGASSQANSNPPVGESSAFVTISISVADQLKMARVNRGLTIDEVAVRLNLRPASIEAMEAGAYEKLPGAAYVAGFVHSYARLLTLDGAALVNQLKVESTALQPKPVSDLPLRVSPRAFPTAGFVWTGLILLLGLLLLWSLRNNQWLPHKEADDVVVSEGMTPPEAGQDGAGSGNADNQAATTETTDAPETGSGDGGSPALTAATPSAAEQPTNPATAYSASDLNAATPAPSPAPAATVGTGGASPTLPATGAPQNTAVATQPSAAATAALGITVKQNSWIQLRDAKGAVVVAKLLRAGESFAIPNTPGLTPGLTMTTGNAGGTMIVVNGQPSPPVGLDNQVVRAIPLDAAPLAEFLAKLPAGQNP